MTTLKLTNLMIRSSDNNPYSGNLSKKDNILAAIELAKLCKDFADTGQTDEAMGIESSQWVEVISKLEEKLINLKETNLMNILDDNYDLNVQFHKEAREMIFSFAVAHYGEKLTLEEWLSKHYR